MVQYRKCVIDTDIAASQMIVSLQQLVSRNCPPNIPSVHTFSKMNSTSGYISFELLLKIKTSTKKNPCISLTCNTQFNRCYKIVI